MVGSESGGQCRRSSQRCRGCGEVARCMTAGSTSNGTEAGRSTAPGQVGPRRRHAPRSTQAMRRPRAALGHPSSIGHRRPQRTPDRVASPSRLECCTAGSWPVATAESPSMSPARLPERHRFVDSTRRTTRSSAQRRSGNYPRRHTDITPLDVHRSPSKGGAPQERRLATSLGVVNGICGSWTDSRPGVRSSIPF